jgi:hypothetical protein
MSLYFVFLRRPGDLSDRRNDPFWEFGSFGRTGCHKKNLLHPRHSRLKDGDRLAFLQGGEGEIRVIALTPPIKVAGSTERIELMWDKAYRPLPYSKAPLLISNRNETAFPQVISALRLKDTNRTTPCGAAASRLRSRTTAVSFELSRELLQWFAPPMLPTITAYPEAIQSEASAWTKHAKAEGWATAAQRARQYKQAGLPVKCGGTAVAAPKARTRRC